jgi:hypothetical protein
MAGGIDSVRQAAAIGVEAPDLRPRQGNARERNADNPFLPAGCRVTPLGIQGLKVWVLDAANQLITMPTDCRKGEMTLIFGGDDWLIEHFPQYPKPSTADPAPEPTGFNQSKVQVALISACFAQGIFDPQGRVFGRGAHRHGDDDEQLALHMGERVLVTGAADKKGEAAAPSIHPAGQLGRRFFPSLAELPPPADEASTPAEAQALLDLFGQWHWLEREAAPLLLLGLSAQMHVCGALKWRSHGWLTGPTAAGKSSLQKVIRAVHHQWALYTEDASEAAVRQVLRDDTLPVLIDEAEPDDNPERQRAILNLMKKASSGAKMHRGSTDHKAQEFTAQSCFLFSSVLHGLVKGEERNRVAILEMRQVPKGESQWQEPDLAHWRRTGRRMHRRMLEQWPRFAQTLADYKREIWSHGLEGRWQDTYGTLLACADLLLFDRPPSQARLMTLGEHGREKAWVNMILPMMVRGKGEARSDVERVVAFLMSRMIVGSNGKAPEVIGQWIARAMTVVGVGTDDPGDADGIDHTARNRLKQYGLRLVQPIDKGRAEPSWTGEPLPSEDGWRNGYLAIAYPTNGPLAELFRGSEWQGGNWLQSLGKIEGAVKGLRIRFITGMNSENAIAIPLAALRGDDA